MVGRASLATFSHTVLPVARSRQTTLNWYFSFGAAPPPNPPPGPPLGPPPPGPNPPPNPPFGFGCFSEYAVVTNTLSPTTIGHDHATPATFTFHATFLSAPHSVGR